MIEWSPTRLGVAGSCLLKYQYTYVPGRKQEGEELPALNFGKAMHDYIQVLHLGPKDKKGRKRKFSPTPERPFYYQTPQAAADAWKGYWLASTGVLQDPHEKKTVPSLVGAVDRSVIHGLKPKRGISWDFQGQVYVLMQEGWQIVYDYVVDNWDSAPPVVVEFPFEIYWQHPEKEWKWFCLTGRIDQVRQREDGSFIVYDLKTDRRDYSRHENQVAIGQSPQFTTYALAALHHPGLKPYFREPGEISVGHYNLRKHRDENGNPKANFFTTTRGPEQFLELARLLETKEAELSLGEYPPTANTQQCPHCQFRKICAQGKSLWASESGNVGELPFPKDYPQPPLQPKQLRLRL